MDGTRIRRALAADLPALAGLEALFPSDALTLRQLRYLHRRASAEILVYAEGAAVLGHAVLLYRTRATCARLYSVMIDPVARGRGIGSQLLEAAEEHARRRGCASMRLEVRADNTGAAALYRRLGYAPDGTVAGYYEDGCDALRFRKPLLPSGAGRQSAVPRAA